MRFKLLTPHFLPGDKLVIAGEEIGEGTRYDVDFALYPPTHEMEGLDEESRVAVEVAMKKFMATDPVVNLPGTLNG